MKLLDKLHSLKPQIAEAAQKIVDEWEQDEEGSSEEFGSGGICDRISESITSIISEAIPEAEFTDGGHEGDDHMFTIVYDDSKAYAIDIPPEVYETGGGFVWRKIKEAKISADNIMIVEVERDLVVDWD